MIQSNLIRMKWKHTFFRVKQELSKRKTVKEKLGYICCICSDNTVDIDVKGSFV